MSVIGSKRHSPRGYKIVVLGLVTAICSIVALTAFSIGQSHTQHQICQAFQFVGQSTQNSISANSQIIKRDVKIGNKVDAATRRKLVSEATSLLIRVNKVRC